jgi:hypothetical protein
MTGEAMSKLILTLFVSIAVIAMPLSGGAAGKTGDLYQLGAVTLLAAIAVFVLAVTSG